MALRKYPSLRRQEEDRPRERRPIWQERQHSTNIRGTVVVDCHAGAVGYVCTSLPTASNSPFLQWFCLTANSAVYEHGQGRRRPGLAVGIVWVSCDPARPMNARFG